MSAQAGLRDCPVVMGLQEFTPVGRRTMGGRDLPAVVLYADEAIVAFIRLRTSSSR